MRMKYTIFVYKAEDGFRWRLVASNGNIMADGAEAYSTKASAIRAANRLPYAVSKAEIVKG